MTSSHEPKKSRGTILVLLGLSLLLAAVGAFVMTDVGQILRIDKAVVVSYFQNHRLFMGASAVLLVTAVLLNRKRGALSPWVTGLAAAGVVVCIVSTKYATPYILFPSQQRGAEYKSIAEVDDTYLDGDDTVYVVEHNGVAKAFPQEYIWQSHIFGGDYGGEEVVTTYCVLTNLPVPYVNDLDGEPMDLKVLAQTNNNLLLWDTNSGEIIQQITSRCELSQRELEPLPVTRMSWSAYRALFPAGEVLYNLYTDPIERVLAFLMPLEDAHSGDSWMFNTVNASEGRLPSKEQVIGVRQGDEAAAYTRAFLREAGVLNTRVGGRALAIAHIPEHDVFVAFDRMTEGGEVEVEEVDFFGNTAAHGRLERVFLYDGPLWAVWAHYFPETELYE